MKQKRHTEIAVIVVCVLALLAAAAWYSSKPDWQPMPASLTKSPDVNRGKIPLGPYAVDFSGLIGGPTGDDMVTLYVVMRPGDVHFQRETEVGRALEGAVAVNGLSINYLPAVTSNRTSSDRTGEMVDGLVFVRQPKRGYVYFHVPGIIDALGEPVVVTCTLSASAVSVLHDTHSFRDISDGSCRARFRPRQDLYAVLRNIPPAMLPSMSSFLPGLYHATSNLIQGEL